MAYTFVDRVMDGLDDLRGNFRAWSKADHTQYFPIACPQNKYALALHNGSLMSVFRVDGYMGQYFPEQFESLSESWKKFLQNTAGGESSAGFDIYWSYEYDPDGMKNKAMGYRKRMIDASAKRGADIKDILEEEAKLYGEICAIESQHIIIVTHIDSLQKYQRKDALAARRKDMRGRLNGNDSMRLGFGLSAIEGIHETHVSKVENFLKYAQMGYAFERLNTSDALVAMRCSFDPSTAGSHWKPKLKMSDVRFRATDGVSNFALKNQKEDGRVLDWTTFFPPKLKDQMLRDNVVDLGSYAVVGDRTYAPLYVDELAVSPEPIETLLRMCFRTRLPVRMVYSITSNSEQANYWNRLFSSIFTFASASNRQISKANKAMAAYKESGGAVFGYGISVTTWAETEVTYQSCGTPVYAVGNIQKRARELETFMQQWGGQQLNNVFGCSVQAAMSASSGYMIPSSTPIAPQIELDIVAQLPIMRPARMWQADNSIWFRTSDGVIQPYQPFSSNQNAMLTLVMGGMGYGKSNLISEHMFYFANHPEIEELPYIRGMDFGASSIGVVDMIRESLPESQKHKAVFQSFTNNGTMIKNMLDTMLCSRYPLEDHFRFLTNWLLTLCDGLVEKGVGIPDLVAVFNAALLRAYEERDDGSNFFRDYRFEVAEADPIVIDMLDRIEFVFDEYTTNWEVVDALADWGLERNDGEVLHAAKLAQRYAVPMFSDLIVICDALSDQFQDMPDIDGKSLPRAISNALMNANAEFPCFAGITNIDVSEAPVCVFDMSEAFGRGETKYDDWLRSVYFTVAHRLLTEDLFVNRLLSGGELESRQKNLKISDAILNYHLDFLSRQDQMLKLYWADEVHRVGKVRGAFSIIDSMTFEGRKYKVGIMLGTQIPKYFPPSMLELATSIFIFGASQSPKNADSIRDIFALTADEREAVLNITKPSKEKGAEVFCIHKTSEGEQKLKLHFQMGGIKAWGYATEAEERGLRGLLYAEGPSSAWAREILAKRVPSVNKAISVVSSKNPSFSKAQAIRHIADTLLATLND